MDCEIEFLPVGEASKAGDAIVIRYGSETSFELMTIDGGTQDSGKAMVEHIQSEFGKSAYIQHSLLTHSDSDHASGLREILKEIRVTNLWLHVPWLTASTSRQYYSNKNWTVEGLEAKIKGEYDIIQEIIDLAHAQGTKVYQPFAGGTIGPFTVLSPAKDVYSVLVPQFDRTPDPDQKAIEATGWWIGKTSLLAKAFDAIMAKATNWIKETWYLERLKDGGITGASNESSTVLYGSFNNGAVLLTADSGNRGLTFARGCAHASGVDLKACNFVQIPHHGSRSNVGPTLLNELIGPIKTEGSKPHFSAYVSAPANDEKHPRKMVLNAFIRRGAGISATQGVKRVYCGGFSLRPGYGPGESYPFSSEVEAYD